MSIKKKGSRHIRPESKFSPVTLGSGNTRMALSITVINATRLVKFAHMSNDYFQSG